MLNSNFVHLHVHNEYSFLDGVGTAEEYIKKAFRLGFKYLALTNHGNIDGLIKFQKAGEKYRIKTILGVELYVVDGDHNKKGKGDTRYHCVILVRNQRGWDSLCRILSIANVEGFYYKPRIGIKALYKHFNSGLILLTGCGQSMIKTKQGFNLISALYAEYPDNVYIEIMPHDIPIQKEVTKYLNRFIKENPGIKVVATNDCHYVNEEDELYQEVLLAISRQKVWNDPERFRFNFNGIHLREADEMISAFKSQGLYARKLWLYGMRETLKIAKMCADFKIVQRDIELPEVPAFAGKDPNIVLREMVAISLTLRLKDGYIKNEIEFDTYRNRANEELDLITRKDFSNYFLLVTNFIALCQKEGIMVGPGRGSVGGSLVAFLIKITQVDPIKYGLLFSRFINEDRIDYPDIDIDFEDRERERAIEILRETYGHDNVAHLTTFLRMRARAVIRDVGRVFETNEGDIDLFAKSIWGNDKDKVLGEEATTPIGRRFKKNHPKVFKIAEALEMQIRGTGKHAAAVIVSAENLKTMNRGHLSTRRSKDIAINWEKDDAEFMGLMKLDILSINALTVLKETAKLIKQKHGKEVDFNTLPLDDPAVFRYLSKGDLTGIFQLTGKASTEVTKQMGVKDFEDIAVIISISRPGPSDSGTTAEYIKRRKNLPRGVDWERKHKLYEEITQETYGMIIYQEQIMQVIHKVAGLPYSTADKIRKVIGKKRDAREFKPYWEAFYKGCINNNTLSKGEAQEFWKMLQFHAGYGFNKSHAIGYSILAYWTAWCKFHYTPEYICTALTYGQEKDKPALIRDAYHEGMTVYPPKMGLSNAIEWYTNGLKLYVPFAEVKGIGEITAKNIVKQATTYGAQTSLFSREEIADLYSGNGGVEGHGLETTLLNLDVFNPDSIPKGLGRYFNFKIREER
uniref:Putative DNA polymerase n=1 Tax=viral metagenome TaxID=1070528 RepID=A0A6M3IQP6_9ZZZZ